MPFMSSSSSASKNFASCSSSRFSMSTARSSSRASPVTSVGLKEQAGKEAVLRLMADGTGLCDCTRPVQVGIEQMIAEDDWVSVEMTLGARTARGEDSRSHHHFAFRVADGRICEVREHLDTLYAQQKLFS